MDFNYVNNILNKKIYDIGRCSNMCWIIFGSKEKLNDEEFYSLHIQCPWRIRRKSEILISCADFYEFSQEVVQENEEWDDKKKIFLMKKSKSFLKREKRLRK